MSTAPALEQLLEEDELGLGDTKTQSNTASNATSGADGNILIPIKQREVAETNVEEDSPHSTRSFVNTPSGSGGSTARENRKSSARRKSSVSRGSMGIRGQEIHEDSSSSDEEYSDEEDESLAGESAPRMVPLGRPQGQGGDMASFFDMFRENAQIDDSDDVGSLASLGTHGSTGSDNDNIQSEKKSNIKKKNIKTGSRGGERVTTEELDAIAEASITEHMRLSAQLPNSAYKRYFDNTGKPILSKDLGKTRGVPKVCT